MTPTFYDRACDLFDLCLPMSAEQRQQLLDQTCRDEPALRREVERMLEGDQSFFEALAREDAPLNFRSLLFAVSESPSSSVVTPVASDQAAPTAGPAEATSRELMESSDFGDYELLGKIAQGGMGIVYKARHRRLKRLVALKVIRWGEWAGQEELERFRLEATAAAGLDHPGIVPVFEYGKVGEQFFYSMAFVHGSNVADRVKEQGPLPPRDAAAILQATAEAVAFAHDRKIIHRDIKPHNVLLDEHGKPRVTDFGLAKNVASDSSLTEPGRAMGTPSYMAPEQADGDIARIGKATDVYSLGATLYFMLTGRPPFQAATREETLQQVRHAAPAAPRRLNPNVPRDLDTICLKCLEKEPRNRIQNAQALADDLQRFRDGVPLQARPVSGLEKLWRWSRRHPAVAGLSTAFVTLFLVAFAVVAALWQLAESRGAMAAQKQIEADDNFEMAWKFVDDYFLEAQQRPELRKKPVRAELLDRAANHFQTMRTQRPDNLVVLEKLAGVYITGIQVHSWQGNNKKALQLAMKATPILEEIKARNPQALEAQRRLIFAWLWLAENDRDMKKNDVPDRAIALAEELRQKDSTNPLFIEMAARAYAARAFRKSYSGQLKAALADMQRAIDLLQDQAAESKNPSYLTWLAKFLHAKGDFHSALKQKDAARQSLAQALAVRKRVVQMRGNYEDVIAYAGTSNTLALNQKTPYEQIQSLQSAIGYLDHQLGETLKQNESLSRLNSQLGALHNNLGMRIYKSNPILPSTIVAVIGQGAAANGGIGPALLFDREINATVNAMHAVNQFHKGVAYLDQADLSLRGEQSDSTKYVMATMSFNVGAWKFETGDKHEALGYLLKGCRMMVEAAREQPRKGKYQNERKQMIGAVKQMLDSVITAQQKKNALERPSPWLLRACRRANNQLQTLIAKK